MFATVELARSRHAEVRHEAEQAAFARRVVAARRWQRRAAHLGIARNVGVDAGMNGLTLAAGPGFVGAVLAADKDRRGPVNLPER